MSSLTTVFPSAVNILGIIDTDPAQVVTVTPHGFLAGSFITIVIPYNNGAFNSLNGKTFLITVLSPSVFTIPVDATNFGNFIDAPEVTVTPVPPAVPFQVDSQIAQAIPAGEFGTTLANASNVIGPNNPLG